MLSNIFKAILLTFLVPLATSSYAQESLDEMEDAPKEFSNFQQEVFDNIGLIFEKNSNELSAIQEKLSENLDNIFDERSQELTSIQEEVFQNLDNIFETNSKELSVVQSELNNLSEQISEIRLELSENKASIVKDAIEASENIVASGIKKSAGSVLFRLDAIEEEIEI